MAVSRTEREVQIKPHGMPDDNRPETVSAVRNFQLSRQPTRPLAVESPRYPGNTRRDAILSCSRVGFDPMSFARDEAGDPS